MGDTTDELLDLAQQVSPMPPAARARHAADRRRADLAWRCSRWRSTTSGIEARSFTGSQAGVITDSGARQRAHHRRHAGPDPTALDEGDIAIVAGFQGVSQDTKDITTLGRGGSDTTAVALAAALGAEVCEIYTDVDGVFTADPRIVPKARKIDWISSEEMLELAASGAKVLHLRCVEYARRYDMPIHVRSSFSTRRGHLGHRHAT